MNKLFSIFMVMLCFQQSLQAFPYGNPAEFDDTFSDGNGKVVGAVVDENTKEAVMYATVTIVAPGTTKPIDGTVTDEKGKFTLNKVKEGEYDIIISFIGYETKTLKNVKIEGKVLDLGNIILGEGKKVLEEVTVAGQRDLFEEKVDRTVYNAEQDESNRGGDASDVLRKVPMLSVDLDGNVSLRGSQNVTVLINNRPSTITAGSIADALKQIPADIIKSVEVITSPSARYDAEGSAGIINIVTKKNTLQGGSLNINVGTGFRGSNLGLNGNYKIGKFGFSLGGFGRAGYNMPGSFENSQKTVMQDGTSITTSQKTDTRNNMMFGRYSLGYEYDINEKNFINGSVQFGLRNGHNYQDGLLSRNFQDEVLMSESLRDVDMTNNSNNVDVNLNYSHTFNRPQHELNVLTQFSRNNRTNNFLNEVYNAADFNSMYMRLKNINLSFNEESTIQVDYQNPLTENQMVEMGMKQIMRTVISDFETFTAVGNGEFQRNEGGAFNNVFNYDQNVTAGYLSYLLTTASKFSLKAGARYEYTTITARYRDGERNVEIPDYGVLVPSLNLSKNLKKGTVKFSYNRRLQRPSLQFLNPNRQNPNPAMLTVGNPLLDPEFTNNFELGYSTYFSKGFLNFTSFARNTNNSIQAIRETLEGGVISTTYENIGRESAFGGSVFGGLNFGKFSLNGGTDFFYADLDNNIADVMQREYNSGFVYNVRGFANYDLTKGWGLQGFGFYRGRQVQLQGYQTGFYIYSLNVRKEFNEKRGSIGFGAENFLNGRGMVIKNEMSSRNGTFEQSSLNVMQNFNLRINFSYRIGKMTTNSGPRRRTKSISNDDMKSGGGGDGGADMAAAGAQGGGMQGGSTPGGGFGGGGRGGAPGKPAPRPQVSSDSISGDGITGRWRGKMGQFELTIDLVEEGETITGTVYTPMGGTPISEGVKENDKEFSFKVAFGPNQIPYKGRFEDGKIILKVTFQGREIENTLERVE